MNNELRTSDVLQLLRTDYQDDTPSYGRFNRLVVEGLVPAHRRGGQWRFKLTDMPAIAAGLGLVCRRWLNYRPETKPAPL